MDLSSILAGIFGLATLLLGSKWLKIKTAISEIKDVIVSFDNALADGNISKTELKDLMEEGKQALEAIKDILK